jgi:nitrogen-specific signal transduction histidine kinase/CheY-like chemotaxis protein
VKKEGLKIKFVPDTWNNIRHGLADNRLDMEAIGTLAGGIAHDFNNILSAIIGHAELSLIDLPKESSLSDNLKQILSAGMRAKELVNQILTFSRQTEVETKPIQVSAIVKETLKLFSVSLPPNIRIQQELQSEALVMADATHIHQVVMNLCTNASHAMLDAGGFLRIRLSEVQIDEDQIGPETHLIPGKFIKLTVTDTGHGVSPEVRNRIFDPFFTTKKRGEGTGMCLSVTHGIIKRYSGIINFDSEPGNGSTFRVYLPIVTGDASYEAGKVYDIPIGSERILFVDDDAVLVEMAKQMLESLGYKVFIRTSGIEALNLFRLQADEFDLVITNMMMPDLTGDILATKINEMKPVIPVVLCTGYEAPINPEQAEKIGIKGTIMKPIVMKDLAILVRNILDNISKKS